MAIIVLVLMAIKATWLCLPNGQEVPKSRKQLFNFFPKLPKLSIKKNLRGVATGASQKRITAAIDSVL
jgi:hypothetical protein